MMERRRSRRGVGEGEDRTAVVAAYTRYFSDTRAPERNGEPVKPNDECCAAAARTKQRFSRVVRRSYYKETVKKIYDIIKYFIIIRTQGIIILYVCIVLF